MKQRHVNIIRTTVNTIKVLKCVYVVTVHVMEITAVVAILNKIE